MFLYSLLCTIPEIPFFPRVLLVNLIIRKTRIVGYLVITSLREISSLFCNDLTMIHILVSNWTYLALFANSGNRL